MDTENTLAGHALGRFNLERINYFWSVLIKSKLDFEKRE